MKKQRQTEEKVVLPKEYLTANPFNDEYLPITLENSTMIKVLPIIHIHEIEVYDTAFRH